MDASLVETHVSVVFFVGDHAYKLKKPVHFDFVDQSSIEAREALCRREVALNRRLAPDVYEDVATVSGSDGQPIDHLVAMRRLPDDRRLSRLVADADSRCGPAIEAIARTLAHFHKAAARGDAIDRAGERDAVAQLWEVNFAQIHAFTDGMLDPSTVLRAEALSERFLAGRSALFAHRIAGRHVCDGHGDLLADDIFVLDDGPRIIDCLEFADHLRYADVVADLAFLVMDLERMGADELAEDLVLAYERHAGEVIPRPLLDLWIAYRAQVRVLVACLRADQADDRNRAVAEARSLLDLCVRHLERATVRLVVVGGLPGTGKSTVADAVAKHVHGRLLRSDVVRKERAGLEPTDDASAPFGTGLYTDARKEGTYRELFHRAARHLAVGESVVLDASFVGEHHRELARQLADECGAALTELRCVLDPIEAAERIRGRHELGSDASDADDGVAVRLASSMDPWPESTTLSSERPIDDVARMAFAAIDPVLLHQEPVRS